MTCPAARKPFDVGHPRPLFALHAPGWLRPDLRWTAGAPMSWTCRPPKSGLMVPPGMAFVFFNDS
jgi:hypothetical protein